MGDIFRFGTFSVDSGGRRLLRDGERVAITSKAFDTLLVLVLRAGQTVEKEEILREVWPSTFISDETFHNSETTNGPGSVRAARHAPATSARFATRSAFC